MSDSFEDFSLSDILGEDDPSIDLSKFGTPSSQTRKHQRDADFILTEGLSEIGRVKGYNAYSPPGLVDVWVSKALKQYSRDKYESTKGYTRRGQSTVGMYSSLRKYGGEISKFTDLSREQRTSMVAAIKDARTAFTVPHKRQPFRIFQTGQHLKTNTSAGYTFQGKKKSDCMPEIYEEARWLAHRIKREGKASFDPRRVRFAPCMAGARGHMSTVDVAKTRLVWVFPAEMLCIEGLFAPIIYEDLAALPNGPLMLGRGSQRLYTEWLCNFKEGEKLHGLDFSGFDTKVPAWLIHTAFDILKGCLDWEYDGTEPHTRKGKQKLSNLWNAVKWYFINTPILMPDGRMFRKHHGVPSGSFFTQLIDSVVNYILVRYVTRMQNQEVRNLKVLGDDSQYRSPSSLDLEQAQRDCNAVNMLLGVDKCEQTEDPVQFKSLGMRYKDGHGYRDDDEWYKFALYPEQPPQDLGTSMSRLVGLWLGGGMFSKAFCDFFSYFQSCYPVPDRGEFSKSQRRWLELLHGGKAPRGWTSSEKLFWRSIFYAL